MAILSAFLSKSAFSSSHFSTSVKITGRAAAAKAAFIQPYSRMTKVAHKQIYRKMMTTPTNGNNDDSNQDNLSKWEQMYNQGSSSSGVSQDNNLFSDQTLSFELPSGDGGDNEESFSEPIQIITFDLDNTVWKTSNVISAANDALFEYLDSLSLSQPERIEVIMGKLFRSNPQVYAPSGGKSPVFLTQLRKDAIYFLLNEYNNGRINDNVDDIDNFVNEAFEVWTKARHDAIPLNYATNVLSTLEKIRSNFGEGNIMIGAITDGNSNPTQVQYLSDYFQFVINAEQVGISKPSSKIYQEAFNYAMATGKITNNNNGSADEIGGWWVHIGDDFIKDIVAAKDMKMRTIWSRELVLDKIKKDQEKENQSSGIGDKDMTQFVENMSREMEKNAGVLNMNIGADDYLADSVGNEFADAIVDSFDQIADVLLRWQTVAMQQQLKNDKGNIPPIQSQISQPQPKPAVMSTLDLTAESADVETKGKSKFCVYCGTQLPMVASFCSSCGEKQASL